MLEQLAAGRSDAEIAGELAITTQTAGRTVRASPDDPQYRVRSDKSGKGAVHQPSALEDDS